MMVLAAFVRRLYRTYSRSQKVKNMNVPQPQSLEEKEIHHKSSQGLVRGVLVTVCKVEFIVFCGVLVQGCTFQKVVSCLQGFMGYSDF